MCQADTEVERHIVGIVEARKDSQVGDMTKICCTAYKCPQAVHPTTLRGRAACLFRVETEKPDDGVEQGIENCQGSREVIQLLSCRDI